MMLGVGYRRELASWLLAQPRSIRYVELTAEHFPTGKETCLGELSTRFRLLVHGLGLSLGTPGPMDPARVDLFARVVEAADPDWISEHVAFTRTCEVDLGHLNPLPPTRQALGIIANHTRELADRCGKPILLENITTHIQLKGELSETDFLNELCERADCGLLLDVTNLFINSRNHGFDPVEWLGEIEPRRIQQLHIVGYSREGDRYTDSHAQPIQKELIDLASIIMSLAPVKAVVLERDENFPNDSDLDAEILKLERLLEPKRGD